MVETRSLTKRYGALAALRDLTLTVEPGEIFGLLGPNGAGKTTLLRLLLAFLRPTSGAALIDGIDCHRRPVQVRRKVAYLPGDARLFRSLKGHDVIHFFADVRRGGDRQQARRLCQRLELDLNRRVAFMSTGMRQKLALAATLATTAPLVILDEPTSNLDPTVRATVADLVREAQHAGRTVLFSSHVLSEVEQVCDRVAILRKGELVHLQVMGQLRRRHRILAELRDGRLPPPPPAVARAGVEVLVDNDQGCVLETPGELAPLLGWLASLPLRDVRIEPAGLQSLYERFHPREAARPMEATP